MGRASADLIAHTRQLWSERAGRAISEEEAQEIIDNMVAFAELVIDWYLADRESSDHSSEDTSSSPDADPSRRE